MSLKIRLSVLTPSFRSDLATWSLLHKCEVGRLVFRLSGVPSASVLFRILPFPVRESGALLMADLWAVPLSLSLSFVGVFFVSLVESIPGPLCTRWTSASEPCNTCWCESLLVVGLFFSLLSTSCARYVGDCFNSNPGFGGHSYNYLVDQFLFSLSGISLLQCWVF